ncbi:WD40 repeat domain-containing protein [Streptomyces sp. NPDC057002]|uniref:WD40 repeat domain-containing protein n=1 Tax=Streptomyces sp. NPDC057002 TaxID=3345992 RepID=UPI00363E3324
MSQPPSPQATAPSPVWRLSDTPSLVFRHPLHNQHLYGGLAWDPGRPVLRYLEGGTVHTLDLTTAVTAAWRDRPLDAVLVSPDGRTFATAELSRPGLGSPGGAPAGSGYTFELRATRDGRLIRSLPPLPVSPDSGLPLMSYSSDGCSLVYGLSTPGGRAAPQRFTVWNVSGNRARGSVDLSATASGAAVVAVALAPGGRTLYTTRTPAVGELSNEAWDTVSGRRKGAATDSRLTSTHLVVRPDGRLIVGDDRVARLPDGPGTARDLVQGEQISALAFSLDGRVLAASDRTGRVALWDGELRHRAGILRNVFPSSLGGSAPEEVSALALSPDGRTLAVGGDTGTLQLWDTLTQQPLGGPLPTPGEAVESLAFSADSSTLYAGGAHVLLQRYTVDPEQAVEQICARAGSSNLTRAQWRTYVPEAAYREVCGD